MAEADITQAGLLGDLEDILYGVGDVVPCEIVYAVVPEFGGVGVVVNGFLGVLVATVVTHPHVETELDKGEGERALGARETYPDLGVHEKAMMEVDDRFMGRRADVFSVLCLLCGKAMKAE